MADDKQLREPGSTGIVTVETAVKALAACVQDLQAQVLDMKRVLLALSYNTTTNPVISQ